MKKFFKGLLVAAAIVVGAGPAVALDVTATNDGNLLVNTILGSGITTSNVTYSGGVAASGTFTGGLASGIGMDSGIILTTGSAVIAEGPNSSPSAGAATFSGTDADLQSLIPGYSVNDATVLEFDFESSGGDLFFNFVFGSEEYNEWVDSAYNDVFGFFLDGTNIALIPGTNTPVTIDTVNLGDSPELYNNNTGIYNLEYDGFTDVLTAQVLSLTTGMHHIKLAIGDAGDTAYDSGVFLQAGSFSDEVTDPVPTPEPSTWVLLGTGLAGLAYYRRKKS